MQEFIEEYLFPLVLIIALTGSLIWYFMYLHNKTNNSVVCIKKCKPAKSEIIMGYCHCQTDHGWEITK